MSVMICIECVIENNAIPNPEVDYQPKSTIAIAVWKGSTLCYRHLVAAFRKLLEP